MYQIQITDKNKQEQSFSLFGMNLKLTLTYNKILKGYQFDLFDLDNNKYLAQMKGLSVGSPSLIEMNLPFVLVLDDKSGSGINSSSKEDFLSRLTLVIMSKEDYRAELRKSFTA